MEKFVDITSFFFFFFKSIPTYFAAELLCALRLKIIRAALHKFFPFFALADPEF